MAPQARSLALNDVADGTVEEGDGAADSSCISERERQAIEAREQAEMALAAAQGRQAEMQQDLMQARIEAERASSPAAVEVPQADKRLLASLLDGVHDPEEIANT